MPGITERVLVKAAPDKVYEVAKASNEFPNFMPDVKEVKILERRANGVVSKWMVEVDGTIFSWKEEDTYNDSERTITFRAIEGDVDKFEGYWKIVPQNSSSLVELHVEFDLNLPGLAELILPTLTQKLRENVRSMLESIKRNLERE